MMEEPKEGESRGCGCETPFYTWDDMGADKGERHRLAAQIMERNGWACQNGFMVAMVHAACLLAAGVARRN
jgi:hypothetical protein